MVSSRFRVGLLTVAILTASALPLRADETAPRRELLELNKITGDAVMAGEMTQLAKDVDHTRKLLKLAQSMAREDEQPFNTNALYILARVAHELKEADAAEQFYRLGVQEAVKLHSGRKVVLSLGGLIDLYSDNKRYDDAVEACREFLSIKGNDSINRLKPAVVASMVQALTAQKKADEAIKLLKGLVQAEESVGGWWFLQLQGEVEFTAERFEDAAKTYEAVLERMTKDEDLGEEEKAAGILRVRYVLSGVYTEIGQTDKAMEQLEILLKERPNDPSYNNDLGYLWADHDMHLARAEKMIRKAIEEDHKQRESTGDTSEEEDKTCAAYLDSMGWVMFKEKKYAEAMEYLLQAVNDKEGQDVETLGHLGDVYRAVGETEDAERVYRQAIETAGPTKREQRHKADIEQKLEEMGE